MKFNKVRITLIILNLVFFTFGISLLFFIVPKLVEYTRLTVATDVKTRLALNSKYITDLISDNNIENNYDVAVNFIPVRHGSLDNELYSFYILDENKNLVYTTNSKYKQIDNFSYKQYIEYAYYQNYSEGQSASVLGHSVYYITHKITVGDKEYMLVYEIFMAELYNRVTEFQVIFFIGFLGSALIILELSYYIDKQYRTILKNRDDLFDTYDIIDDSGLSTVLYIRRIKKVLHTFVFSTAKLFAINKNREIIFRNQATLDMEFKRFGRSLYSLKYIDEPHKRIYQDTWIDSVNKLLDTDEEYLEWKTDAIDINGQRFCSVNRIKKIIVEGDPVVIGEIQDTTEKTIAEEQAAEYSNYLETIFNTVRDVILIIGLNGNIVDSNLSSDEILGYETSELIGENIEQVLDVSILLHNDNHMMRKVKRKDGIYIDCEIYINTIDTATKDQLHLLVIKDITEQEKLKQQVYSSIAVTVETMKTIADNI